MTDRQIDRPICDSSCIFLRTTSASILSTLRGRGKGWCRRCSGRSARQCLRTSWL